MNLQETLKAIEDATNRLYQLEGNTEIRDNLLRASSNLSLLSIYAKKKDIPCFLGVVKKLIENEHSTLNYESSQVG